MEPDTPEQAEERMKKAMEILEPFGFSRSESYTVYPKRIRHELIGESFDISASDPYQIIQLVLKRGISRGIEKNQIQIQKSIGLK